MFPDHHEAVTETVSSLGKIKLNQATSYNSHTLTTHCKASRVSSADEVIQDSTKEQGENFIYTQRQKQIHLQGWVRACLFTWYHPDGG